MITVSETKLKHVMAIRPSVFEDHRGEYIELYNKKEYEAHGVDVEFVADDISISYRNALRGIHGDDVTWKLVSCLYGRIYLVVVNCDRDSKDFGQWQALTLSGSNRAQVLIPPKFGNGHLVLSDRAIFHYKQSEYYQRETQFTYRFDYPRFGIWWPVKNPILSKRDEEGQ